MNRRKTKVAATFLLLLSSAVGQQPIPASPKAETVRAFNESKGLPDEIESSYFQFSTSDLKFTVTRSGNGKRAGGRSPAHSLNLHLQTGDSLTRNIYYAEHQGDLVLICEVSDGNYGAGFITRLDGRTLRMKWKRSIPAFNVGQGLIEGSNAYVTAIGFIGKVNINTGVYIWRHDNLYQQKQSAFNSFELPEIEGDVVVFRETKHYLRQKVATIEVEKRTGKVKRVDV